MGLGHAVAVDDGSSQRLFQLGEHFGANRRRAAGEQSNVTPAPGGRFKLGPVEKAIVERGNGHEHGCLSHEFQRMARMERIGDNHAATCQEAQVHGERKPMNVKQRQHVDEHIVGCKPPERLKRPQTGSEVGVCVYDPLRPSGRARAVEHQARCLARERGFGSNTLGCGDGSSIRQDGRPRVRANSLLQRLDRRVLLQAGYDNSGATIGKKIAQLFPGEPRVQGKRNGSRIENSQVGRYEC